MKFGHVHMDTMGMHNDFENKNDLSVSNDGSVCKRRRKNIVQKLIIKKDLCTLPISSTRESEIYDF